MLYCVAGPAQHQLAGPGFLNMDPEFVHSFRDYITEMIDATKPEIMDDQAFANIRRPTRGTRRAPLHAPCTVQCHPYRERGRPGTLASQWVAHSVPLRPNREQRCPRDESGSSRVESVCAHVCR